MTLSIIVAIGPGREIGFENKLLMHIPEDLRYFKKITTGHPVIMGRKTYDSIGRLLPNRTNIILTKNQNWSMTGAVIAHSLEQALMPYRNSNTEVFVIGGGAVYEQAILLADTLYITHTPYQGPADTWFPIIDGTWELDSNEPCMTSVGEIYFTKYKRV